ncbi:hypothetical protein D5086_023017 [Populus alba]|uniref:Uncharacterized protein n=1 Tax=Populus alba TaxID=43335 RepID=A0ACC4B9A3_POPAL
MCDNEAQGLIFDILLFRSVLYGDAKGRARRFNDVINLYIPRVMNPHAQAVQKWNKFFVISCLVAIFVDPLFFFLLWVQQVNNCIVIDWPMTKTIVVFRSLTDLIYLLNMLLQFMLAYVAPESRVVGAGELVDHPKKILKHYLQGCFFIDLIVVLPLPQNFDTNILNIHGVFDYIDGTQHVALNFFTSGMDSLSYQSPYWRARAATLIQVAWRYRQKCLKHSKSFQSNHFSNSRV